MSALALFASVSRLHIVAIAALGNFTFCWLLTGRHSWSLAAICGLDWFLVNLLNRVVDLPEDRANRIHGTDFVARHRREVLWGGFSLLSGSLVAIHFVSPALTMFRIAYHALGLAYNWPLFPGGRRIKQLYFWKNTASATGFLITVFGYPLAAFGHPRLGTLGLAAAAGFFFLFELSYEVIYDLRDAPGDAQAGVRTFPVAHGERGAVRIIDALIGGSMALLAAGFIAHALPWRVFIMILAPLIQVVVYKRALRRGITASDCVGLTWLGAALLATYHLWIAAGLPGVGV
ncbi:MAG TPA: UbiA family prenyltransferase [Polyangia bacterium]|nr:UbiA family prenyltransferase [Polyangia bacterium]